ncbi:MAG: hypothetical protein JJT89_12640 [Nitriliruptoraceae bacterium]|nr:hypothetical protein [Nitriliruptoraceae bacterium]
MTDDHTPTLDLEQLPGILGAVLGAMPAQLADGWRQVAADAPGMSMHPVDQDGWIRVELGGFEFCAIHLDALRPGTTEGLARITVDGAPQLLDLHTSEQ